MRSLIPCHVADLHALDVRRVGEFLDHDDLHLAAARLVLRSVSGART